MAPTETHDDDVRRRRWQAFLAVEGGLLLLAIVATWAVIAVRPARWVAWPIGVLWSWLIWTLPIGVLYLLGHPPVMSLVPLVRSPESRRFRRKLKERPALSDDDFYVRFYQGSGIPKDILVRVRRCLLELDGLADRIVPGDCLPLLEDELDYADVLHWVGRELGVRFTRADYPAVDGTFDNLVRLIHTRLA